MKYIFLLSAALAFAPATQANAVMNFPVIEKIEKAPDFVKNEILCLSKNIFFEARNSTRKDQIWTGFVTFNRVAHPNFSDTICDVVYENSQFSWTEHSKQKVSNNDVEQKTWEEIQHLAYDIYSGRIQDPTGGLTHFYNGAMKKKPKWAKNASEQKVGKHVYVDVKKVGKVVVHDTKGYEIVK